VSERERERERERALSVEVHRGTKRQQPSGPSNRVSERTVRVRSSDELLQTKQKKQQKPRERERNEKVRTADRAGGRLKRLVSFYPHMQKERRESIKH